MTVTQILYAYTTGRITKSEALDALVDLFVPTITQCEVDQALNAYQQLLRG